MIDSVTQDVRYALRTLSANRAFTLVAVLSLALGIGGNTAIFSLLDAVMLKYLPVQHPEELVQVNVGTFKYDNRLPEGVTPTTVTNAVWEELAGAGAKLAGMV